MTLDEMEAVAKSVVATDGDGWGNYYAVSTFQHTFSPDRIKKLLRVAKATKVLFKQGFIAEDELRDALKDLES